MKLDARVGDRFNRQFQPVVAMTCSYCHRIVKDTFVFGLLLKKCPKRVAQSRPTHRPYLPNELSRDFWDGVT